MNKVMAASLGALVVAFTLSGCITIQLPAGTGDGQASGSTITCEQTQTITESGTYRLTGRCPNLAIEANDVVVTAGDVVNLDITGDRVNVTSTETTTLVIGGNSNIVEAGALSDAQIAGDRNSVHTVGALDRAVINGNDNKIAADGGVISVFDNGERTEIGGADLG